MNKKMKTEKQMMKLPVYAGILFSVLEIMMALYANSQAVLMDSIYDFAEAIVLGLIIFLIPLFYKPVSERKPFGYAQVESLLILGKGLLLIAVTIGLILANVQMLLHGGNTIDQQLIGYFEFGLAMISAIVLWLLTRMHIGQLTTLLAFPLYRSDHCHYYCADHVTAAFPSDSRIIKESCFICS